MDRLAFTSLIGLMTFAGCALIDADPAPDSGYVESPERMTPWPERAAFVQRIWFKDRQQFYTTRHRFTKIHFAPTLTDFLKSPGWWDELNAAGPEEYKNDVTQMAKYLDETLREVFRADSQKRFEVTETPDASTVVFEFAIVELRPTKVAVNAAGTALSAFVPGGGVIKSTAKGSIAVEVTGRDGANDELLLSWADREIDQSSPFSFRDFLAYAHAKKTARRWAEDLLKAWNTAETVLIDDPSPITLDPF